MNTLYDTPFETILEQMQSDPQSVKKLIEDASKETTALISRASQALEHCQKQMEVESQKRQDLDVKMREFLQLYEINKARCSAYIGHLERENERKDRIITRYKDVMNAHMVFLNTSKDDSRHVPDIEVPSYEDPLSGT
ncbi:hypothetical protein QR680_003234 [Steinernema hermaphroditum]|uniref:Uncharacterized protein n=1 Tax=Steinernema hermaphroditum TaxID=289476 RepID=A0AA39LJX0_9BILA|nr:hypothetical protein QR680_003234 [Steinernema hermaphroditum]